MNIWKEFGLKFNRDRDIRQCRIEIEKFHLTSLFYAVNEYIRNNQKLKLIERLSELIGNFSNSRQLFDVSDEDFNAIVGYAIDIKIIAGANNKDEKKAAWERIKLWTESGKPSFIFGDNFDALGDMVYFD